MRERCSLRERGVAGWGRGADPPAELSRRCSCSAGMANSAPAAVPTRTSDRIGAYPVRNLCACRQDKISSYPVAGLAVLRQPFLLLALAHPFVLCLLIQHKTLATFSCLPQ